jgi:hypothetical protein
MPELAKPMLRAKAEALVEAQAEPEAEEARAGRSWFR